jgi:hypothetical protein
MPVAHRHHRAAKKSLQAAGPAAIQRHEYRITDPTHRPDLRGHLGGVEVVRRGVDQFVRMTEKQAEFYLATGSIERVQHHKKKPDAPTPAPAPEASKTQVMKG